MKNNDPQQEIEDNKHIVILDNDQTVKIITRIYDNTSNTAEFIVGIKTISEYIAKAGILFSPNMKDYIPLRTENEKPKNNDPKISSEG